MRSLEGKAKIPGYVYKIVLETCDGVFCRWMIMFVVVKGETQYRRPYTMSDGLSPKGMTDWVG